jgi:hypothetical protein
MPHPKHSGRVVHGIQGNAFLIGLLSLIWFLLRTGRKPSRAAYPCQQVAAINSQMWLAVYVFPIFSAASGITSSILNKKRLIITIIALIAVSSLAIHGWRGLENGGQPPDQADSTTGIYLAGRAAESEPASDIFVVCDTSGNDGGVTGLINLMGSHGLIFYCSPWTGGNQGPGGLIASDDVILIKINCQWDERGGTNTDLLGALIQAILDHPDGFSGEIVVADNGQGQYGSSGGGGSLDWGRSNAEDTAQSVQKVVDSFVSSARVSSYLWDTITTRRVDEYSEGDTRDGYVVNTTVNPRTGVMVSYPKFKTVYGTHVSLKLGVWDPDTGAYDGEKLKIINVPVLKSHSIYGVTACVKHYMGVPSDKLTAGLGSRTHDTVGSGGMGTLMVETRFPTLNILDAIWVNANPPSASARSVGPRTPYERATGVYAISASTDPVALDCWAAKHILLQVAPGGVDASSMDPDQTGSGSFGAWLRLSMHEISGAGYQATVHEGQMNVYVERLDS